MKTLKRWRWIFLAHEDEAQMTGVIFTQINDNLIEVQTTFRIPEYETPPVRVPAEEARTMWRRLQKDEWFKLQKRVENVNVN